MSAEPRAGRENLKNARKAAGMTQQQVAEEAGLSYRQYQRIENGAAYGTIETWDALEDLFGINQRVLRQKHPDPEANRRRPDKGQPS